MVGIGVTLAGVNIYTNDRAQVVRSDRNLLAQLASPETPFDVVQAGTDTNTPVATSYISNAVALASNDEVITETVPAAHLELGDTLNPFEIVTLDSSTDASLEDTIKAMEIREHVVKPGETVSTIAAKYGVDVATILQQNKIYADDTVKAGKVLEILPVSGSTVTLEEGKTLDQIATDQGVDIASILETNGLFTASDAEVGQTLIIPEGKRDQYVTARPKPRPQPTRVASTNTAPRTQSSTSAAPSAPVTAPAATVGTYRTSGRFPFGQCTYHAAQMRPDIVSRVSWLGNAGQWYHNAASAGLAVGRIPAVGSVIVTRESYWGHVAYVTAVHGNSITITEMNYAGNWGRVTSRSLSASNPLIVGYIY